MDPTLIFTPKILENPKFISRHVEDKYAIFYGTVFTPTQQTLIKDYCKKRKIKIISVGYYNAWLELNHLDLNPTTFYDYIKKAEVIFTSMFHGIMFSSKLSKQFYFTIDPIRKNKIQSFLDTFNLQNRAMKENINDYEIDLDELEKNIHIKASNSKKIFN